MDKEQTQVQTVKDNSFAVLFDKDEPRLIQLIAGNKIQFANGAAYRHMSFINQPWATKIQAFNKTDTHLYALKPKSTLITDTLARKTQILYQMDNSAILFKLDIKPGSVVIEAGTGSGSLSCAFAQTIQSQGRLFTFQFNKERAQITKQFFQDLGYSQVTSNWRDVVADGFSLQGKQLNADALFLDVPNPWAAITHAKNALKKHGRICCFSPCIEQVQRTSQQLRKQKFIKLETIECLSRELQFDRHVQQQGVSQKKRTLQTKAVHNSRGHTGYLTFAISL